MQRPKPTKKLLYELCGGNESLLSSLHHGLVETPMYDFYPNLNLDELVVFESTSWALRRDELVDFIERILRAQHIHDVFKYALNQGFPWLNSNKGISPESQNLYEQLNPFKGRNLRERLGRVDRLDIEKLRENLQRAVSNYLFESKYHAMKKNGVARGGGEIPVMIFQPSSAFGRDGKRQTEAIVNNYAAKNAEIISQYPTEYLPPPRQQISLF